MSNENNKSFTVTNPLVQFIYLLQQHHLTGEQIEGLIKEAKKINRHNSTKIVPYTAGLHANYLVNELVNRRG